MRVLHCRLVRLFSPLLLHPAPLSARPLPPHLQTRPCLISSRDDRLCRSQRGTSRRSRPPRRRTQRRYRTPRRGLSGSLRAVCFAAWGGRRGLESWCVGGRGRSVRARIRENSRDGRGEGTRTTHRVRIIVRAETLRLALGYAILDDGADSQAHAGPDFCGANRFNTGRYIAKREDGGTPTHASTC